MKLFIQLCRTLKEERHMMKEGISRWLKNVGVDLLLPAPFS